MNNDSSMNLDIIWREDNAHKDAYTMIIHDPSEMGLCAQQNLNFQAAMMERGTLLLEEITLPNTICISTFFPLQKK